MSATIISMTDFEASKAQVKKASQYVRRPVSVTVDWSEAGCWEKGQVVPFAEFEKQAAEAALAHAGAGYMKTSVTVKFDDATTFDLRIDLAASDALCIADHWLSQLRYAETEEGRQRIAAYPDSLRPGIEYTLSFIRGIDFGTDEQELADLREQAEIAEAAALLRKEQEARATAAAEDKAKKEARAAEVARLAAGAPEYAHLAPLGEQDRGGVAAAKNVRRDLKKAFPGVKFSVKSSYTTINVSWQDGPTRGQVEDVIDKYQEGTFDGMTDCYDYHTSPFNERYGAVQYTFAERAHGEELRATATRLIEQQSGETVTGDTNQQIWGTWASTLVWREASRITLVDGVWHHDGEPIVWADEQQQAEPVVAIEDKAAAPSPVKPKFTANQAGGVWSVTIEQGEECHQFDGITAASLAEACRIAWAMLTQPTPPDDDPSGQPLPVEPAAEQAAPVEQGATAPTLTHIHQLLDTGRLGEPGEVFQLCLRHDKAPTSKIPAIGIASVKKDGMFVAALHCKGRPWFFARSGQLMTNTDLLNIPAAVLDALQASPNLIHQFEFKADALRQSVFNGAVSPVRVNPVDPEVAPLLPAFTPWLINVIPVADFIGNGDGQQLAERKAMAKAISERHGLPMPEHRRLSWGDAMAWFAVLVEQNEEGIVYDNPEAAYAPGARRADLSIKRARELRLDLRCVGIAEGKGKHAGVVGKLLFEYEGAQIPADLGEGWCYADRVRMMVNPAEAVGQVFEVYAFDVSELGSLRQAKVGQPRPDKVIAD